MAVFLDGKTFADATMVIALGITMAGEKRFPRLRRNGHGERDGADAVPAVVGRAGPRPLPGRAGDPGWRQGAPHGRPEGLPEPGPGPPVPVAQARERGEPSGQARAGGVASAPPARLQPSRTTTRPSVRSRRSSASWTSGTSRRAGSLAEGLDETLTLHRLGVYGVLGPVVQDDELSGVCQCAGRGTVREGRSLADLEPTPPLAGDGAPGHRTTSAEGDGLPPSVHAS